jgi:hypothetical protein
LIVRFRFDSLTDAGTTRLDGAKTQGTRQVRPSQSRGGGLADRAPEVDVELDLRDGDDVPVSGRFDHLDAPSTPLVNSGGVIGVALILGVRRLLPADLAPIEPRILLSFRPSREVILQVHGRNR